MIEGYIDEYGQPKVDIEAAGMKLSVLLNAIVDTGFNGDLCLPLQVALQLGLELRSAIDVEFADGSRKQELVFIGTVKLGNETKEAWITLTNSEDALIGTNMFSKLEIDFSDNKVIIE